MTSPIPPSKEEIDAAKQGVLTYLEINELMSVDDDIRTILSALSGAEKERNRLALYVWADSAHRGGCSTPSGHCSPECPRGLAQRLLEVGPREARGWTVTHPNGDYWVCVLHKEVVRGPGTAYETCSGCDALDSTRSSKEITNG